MIQISNLTKEYGDLKAVDDISFSVKDGEILGFLGPNGAGKSTTLKIITTYLAPTAGDVRVNDLDIRENPLEVRSLIGYLPEMNPLYEDMVAYDQLRFAANMRGISGKKYEDALERVMDACGIKRVIHRPINELSRGYHQRVGLAMAMIHDPEILILDEPTSGLDPNQIIEIRDLITRIGREKTVIMSTHILQEVQALADRMAIINEGRLVADGTTSELMAGFHGNTQLALQLKNATRETLADLPTKVSNIKVLSEKPMDGVVHMEIEYPTGQDVREHIFRYAVESGWTVLEMARKQTNLEEIFRTLTSAGGAGNA